MGETWFLVFCRVAPTIALHPIFGSRVVPRSITVGIAAAITCTVACGRDGTAVPLLSSAVPELALGITVGVLGQAVFGAIEAAGRFVDDARGANVARLYSPQLEAASSPIGQLELTAALALYWGLGLHAPLLRAAFVSFEPVRAGVASLDGALGVASTLAHASLALAGPAAACCVLVDLLMGLVSRSAPGANVFLLGQPVKLVAAVLVTALGAPVCVEGWGELWHAQLEWTSTFVGR